MERINRIWLHPLYQEQFTLLQEAEKDRIFCNHTLAHFLDVARLAWIACLEERAFALSKELVYAAALLHDIGRYQQIVCGTPHEEAGCALTRRILPDCGFTEAETDCVCHAIANHRSRTASKAAKPCSADDRIPAQTAELTAAQNAAGQDAALTVAQSAAGQDAALTTAQSAANQTVPFTAELLSWYLYRADKQSRCCFACPAAAACNWSMEKRNLKLLH